MLLRLCSFDKDELRGGNSCPSVIKDGITIKTVSDPASASIIIILLGKVHPIALNVVHNLPDEYYLMYQNFLCFGFS